MYFPFRVDFHGVNKIRCGEEGVSKKRSASAGKTLGRKRQFPEESTAIFEFENDFSFIKLLCGVTFAMELGAPGSSNISFLGDDYSDQALPTGETDVYTHEHLMEYIAREIYHTCKMDQLEEGPYSFICHVSKYLKERFELKKDELSPTMCDRLNAFFDRILPSRADPNSKHLLEYVDSHIIVGGRWFQMVRSFRVFTDMQSCEDFVGAYSHLAKSHKTYQTSCSHHHAKIAKYQKSLEDRFLSWWLTAVDYLEEELFMQDTLMKSLEKLFDYDTILFSSGFQCQNPGETSGLNKTILHALDDPDSDALFKASTKYQEYVMALSKVSGVLTPDEVISSCTGIKSIRVFNICQITERFNTKRNKRTAKDDLIDKMREESMVKLKMDMDVLRESVGAESVDMAVKMVESEPVASTSSASDFQESENYAERATKMVCTVDCGNNSMMMERVEDSSSTGMFSISENTLCNRAESAIELLHERGDTKEVLDHLQQFVSLNSHIADDNSLPGLTKISDCPAEEFSVFGNLENSDKGLLYTKLMFDDSVPADAVDKILK